METENDRGLAVGALAPMADVLEGLNDLLQLDHDAVSAYSAAIERIENREHALQIEGFRKDHERHIRELSEIILQLGGTPRNEPHVTGPLKEGIQRVAAIGGDASILAAWRVNELQVTTKYDRYARDANAWPKEAKRLVDANALDEARHYQWVVSLLSDGNAPELHLANRLREEGGVRARDLREKASRGLERASVEARLRTAEGIGFAADRLERFASERPAADDRAAAGARRLAERLDSTAAYLQNPGETDVKQAVEAEIRDNPGRSLVAALAIGFVLGRILR